MSRSLASRARAVARPAVPRIVVGCAAAALTILQAAQALAYCRATTCGDGGDDYCAVGDNGCVIDGLPLAWPQNSTLDFVLDEESAEEADVFGAAQALENAVDTWSEVSCGNDPPKISLAIVDEDDAPDGAGTIDVVFVSSGWPYENDAVGRTVIEFYQNSGWVSGATLLLNAQHYVLSRNPDETEVDLTAVLTHEIGHVLALAHSSAPGSTMESETTTAFASEIRTLAHDDEVGLCALYPPDSQTVVFDLGEGGSSVEMPEQEEDPPSGTCAYGAPGHGAAAWLPLGLLAAALGFTRLRTHHRRTA